jgi:hypothetical protein
MIAGGLFLIPLLWFGIPAVTSKSAFTAGNIAQHSPRELKSNKFFGTLDRFLDLHEMPVQLAALGAVGLAFYRRHRWLLILAAGTVVWVLVEAAFALHGWPAVPRYLFEAVGVMCVVAGVFIGRVILDLPPLLARAAARLSPQRIGPGLAHQIGNWAAVLVVVLFAGSMLPAAKSRWKLERRDLTHERARTTEFGRLSTVVNKLGASRILACGQPNIPIAYQSVLAWYMGVKVGQLYYSPGFEKAHPHPTVNIYPLPNGWKVFPSHLNAASAANCKGLRLVFRS